MVSGRAVNQKIQIVYFVDKGIYGVGMYTDMKVGIISIFDNNNFGNRLQNYALQQTLRQYTTEIVTIKNKPYYSGKSRLLRVLPFAESPFFNRAMGMDRRARFADFTSRFICFCKACYWYEKEYSDLKKSDMCDRYCAGSDQVWNPACGRSGMFNYLGFADYDATFSYAASFGIDRIPDEYVEDVRKGLQHIKYISVREDAGKRIVEELTGRTDVQVLVDPTMLLTTQEWDQILVKPQKEVPEKYVLTYFLGEVSPQRGKAIRDKAAEMGCELIELMDNKSPFYVSGPSEFLYLIKHASLICTDSFHGSVFSFLYGRPLAIFEREDSGEDMGSRIRTFSDKFQLENCLVKDNRIHDQKVVDYSAGYAVLAEERIKSKAFLDMVFREADKVGLCKEIREK